VSDAHTATGSVSAMADKLRESQEALRVVILFVFFFENSLQTIDCSLLFSYTVSFGKVR
jgi:hypothetical protein